MLFAVGTKVRSVRDSRLRGTIVGMGALLMAGPEYTGLGFDPLTVYLVWVEGVQGSSSLGPAIRCFDPRFTEECE